MRSHYIRIYPEEAKKYLVLLKGRINKRNSYNPEIK